MNGYVCRSKGTDDVFIGIGRAMPSLDTTGKRPGWFWHAPGWFTSLKVRTFKRKFGFTVEPGTVKKIKLNITEDE